MTGRSPDLPPTTQVSPVEEEESFWEREREIDDLQPMQGASECRAEVKFPVQFTVVAGWQE